VAVVIRIVGIVEDFVVYEVVEKRIGSGVGIERRSGLGMGDEASCAIGIEGNTRDEEPKLSDGCLRGEPRICIYDIEEEISAGVGGGGIEAVAPGVGAVEGAIIKVDDEGSLSIAGTGPEIDVVKSEDGLCRNGCKQEKAEKTALGGHGMGASGRGSGESARPRPILFCSNKVSG